MLRTFCNETVWRVVFGPKAHLRGLLMAKLVTKGREAKIPTLAAPDMTAA